MSKAVLSLIAVSVLIAASTSAAAEPFNPKAIADTIAPLIGADTYAIIRINVAKIDLDAFGQFMSRQPMVPLPERLTAALVLMEQWRSGFLATGATEIFVLRSTRGPLDAEPVWIVPVPARAQADAVAAALRRPMGPGTPGHTGPFGQRGLVSHVGAFVVGAIREKDVTGLKTLTADTRPELADAIAAAGDAAIQVIVMPSQQHRAEMEKATETVPGMMQPMPISVVSRGFRWAAVGLKMPPKPALQLCIQGADEPTAKALSDAVGRLIEVLAIRLGGGPNPQIQQALQTFKPKPSGSRLILEMNHQQIQRSIEAILPPAVVAARQRAQEAVSLTNLMDIGAALMMYAFDHNNQRPTALEQLIGAEFIVDKHLISPISGRKAYVYIRPQAGTPDRTIVVYEDPATHGRAMTAVLYHSSTVAMVPVDDAFWAAVDQAKARSAAAGEPAAK